MHRKVFCGIGAVAALLFAASGAHAQGYGVFEQSACVSGRAGATVAAPCPDASAIYFNPAGIVLTPGQVISLGATAIAPRGYFTDSATGQRSPLINRYYPVPQIYYKRNFAGDRFAAGVGGFAPYGLTTDWPTTSEGRYLGYKSLIQSIYLQPTVAFKITDKIAVGGGVDITYTKVELRQRVDLSAVPITGTPFTFGTIGVPAGTDFADVMLKGHAYHAGVNLGVIASANDKISVGVRYMSGQRVSITNGEVTTEQILTGQRLRVPLGPSLPAGTPIDAIVAPQFAAGGRLSDQTATTSIPLPDQVVAGVAIHATPELLVLADYQFTRWSMFNELKIVESVGGTIDTIEQYKNTSGGRFGMDYTFDELTNIRAGVEFNQAAAPPQTVTPNLPEAKRVQVSVGAGRKFGSARIDGYYMYLHQGNRDGRTIGPPSGVAPTTALNNGVYNFNAHLFGVTLAFGF